MCQTNRKIRIPKVTFDQLKIKNLLIKLMDIASLEKLQTEVFFFFFRSLVYAVMRLIVWKNKIWIR